MNIVLTPELIQFLIRLGYRYCLSKTSGPVEPSAEVRITLVPAFAKPNLGRLPTGCDTYFEIEQEPMQLAEGVDETLVMMQLDKDTLLAYVNFLTNPIKMWKVAHG